MPAKPNKYGIKFWMAADSSNGYVLNFDVYLGKELDGRLRIYGLGFDVVQKYYQTISSISLNCVLMSIIDKLDHLVPWIYPYAICRQDSALLPTEEQNSGTL